MGVQRTGQGAGTRRVTLTRTVRPPAIHTAGRSAKANPNGIPGDHLLLVCSPVVWLRGGGRAVAVFPFAAVAAGARPVAGPARIRGGVGVHELRGCPVLAQQTHHGLQGFSDVPEERLVTRTQVMLTRFAVRRTGSALPVSGLPVVLPAHPRTLAGHGESAAPGPGTRGAHARLRRRGCAPAPQRAVHLRQRPQMETLPRRARRRVATRPVSTPRAGDPRVSASRWPSRCRSERCGSLVAGPFSLVLAAFPSLAGALHAHPDRPYSRRSWPWRAPSSEPDHVVHQQKPTESRAGGI